MGWGRFLLLGDLGQQLDLSSLDDEVNRLQRDALRRTKQAMDLRDRIDSLEQENEGLRLSLGVLIQILGVRSVLSEKEISDIVSAGERDKSAETAFVVDDVLPSDDPEIVDDQLSALAAAKQMNEGHREFAEFRRHEAEAE